MVVCALKRTSTEKFTRDSDDDTLGSFILGEPLPRHDSFAKILSRKKEGKNSLENYSIELCLT